MAIQTSLGTAYAISAGPPATFDEAGYAALSYTDVGEVTNLGDFGATFEDVTNIPLLTGITEHRKGAIDYGELAMVVAYDVDDAGQILVESGVDGANRDVVYSHEVTLQDGQILYFTGQFFSAPLSVGDASTMVTTNVNVKLSTQPVKVAAP
jgi:hypothetical protein